MPPPPTKHDNLRVAIRYLPTDEVKDNPRDPRTYKKQDLLRAKQNLETCGVIIPFIIQQDATLLFGRIWWEAAKLAHIPMVPTITVEHLTPAQLDAFMLASNRLIERGDWDKRLLGEVLQDLSLQELDFTLDITGFEPAEIDMLIEGLNDEDAADAADELPPTGPRVTRPEDMWQCRDSRLICGDSRDPAVFLRLMGHALATIVFADAPYNLKIPGNVSGLGKVKHGNFAMASGELTEPEFIDFLETVMKLAAQHSVDGSLHYFAIDWRHVYEMIVAGRRVYTSLENLCVWSKSQPAMGSFYRSQHELFLLFQMGRGSHKNNIQLGRFGRNRSNVWTYPGANSFGRQSDEGNLLKLHPTVKPVALITDVLLDASTRGDAVLDPFMGSGSTLIAAEKVGRRAYGIELSPEYVDVAVRRWERWTGEQAVLDGDGRTFREIENIRAEEASDER